MKKTCLHCGYTWITRIETRPKACPKCKNTRWSEEPRKAGRTRGKQSIITALNAGADPVDFGFDCRADDGQGNEYWCKNQGATIVRLNCYTDPETDKKYWDDNVSGWENHQ